MHVHLHHLVVLVTVDTPWAQLWTPGGGGGRELCFRHLRIPEICMFSVTHMMVLC